MKVLLIAWYFLLLSVISVNGEEETDDIAYVPPPQEPPTDLIHGYTMNGEIPLELLYVDDTDGGKGTNFSFPEDHVDKYIDIYERELFYQMRLILEKAPDLAHKMLGQVQWVQYSMMLHNSSLNNSKVCVFGSMNPWLEAVALYFNASKVTTIEYNNLTYNNEKITTIAKHEFSELYSPDSKYLNSFDVCLSVSAFNHDGLGRYGDPLDPDGDLKAMDKAKSLLKPGGLLFLTVPVGPDITVFNLNRRYGDKRLPLLLEGWEEVERFGFEEHRLTMEKNFRRIYEPVFILKKPNEVSDKNSTPPFQQESRKNGIFKEDAVEEEVFSPTPPPKEPPQHMVSGYSMNGDIPIEKFYVDDTNRGNGTHFEFPDTLMKSYLQWAEKLFPKFQVFLSKDYNAGTKLLNKEQWIPLSMAVYNSSFKDANTCVFGSMEPWVEAAALFLNASKVVTIEYNNLTYGHERVVTISKYQFPQLYGSGSEYLNSFDVCLSVSSFDHDGLGRYGDPLDPDGDLKAMKKAFSLLKPGGLLFLTVPVGPDVTVFNLQRRYGDKRLPLLLEGWEEVERIGWVEGKLTKEANYRRTYEPVFVLKKPDFIEKETEVGQGEL